MLSKPTAEEKPLIESAILNARDAVIYAIEYGFEKAMSKMNVKPKKEKIIRTKLIDLLTENSAIPPLNRKRAFLR